MNAKGLLQKSFPNISEKVGDLQLYISQTSQISYIYREEGGLDSTVYWEGYAVNN